MAGIFYTIYGLNDWIFFIFFSYVFLRLMLDKNSQKLRRIARTETRPSGENVSVFCAYTPSATGISPPASDNLAQRMQLGPAEN